MFEALAKLHATTSHDKRANLPEVFQADMFTTEQRAIIRQQWNHLNEEASESKAQSDSESDYDGNDSASESDITGDNETETENDSGVDSDSKTKAKSHASGNTGECDSKGGSVVYGGGGKAVNNGVASGFGEGVGGNRTAIGPSAAKSKTSYGGKGGNRGGGKDGKAQRQMNSGVVRHG